jgi:hypothetical protein
MVGAKFPKHSETSGALSRYAIMRAMSVRMMRMPKPKVKPGDQI